jgi:hypothetical protein
MYFSSSIKFNTLNVSLSVLSIFIIAKSVNGSSATTLASNSFHSLVITVYFALVSETTCLLVIITHSLVMKNQLHHPTSLSTLHTFS